MKIIHQNGFTAEELELARVLVMQNVFTHLRTVFELMETSGSDFEFDVNRETHKEVVREITDNIHIQVNKTFR